MTLIWVNWECPSSADAPDHVEVEGSLVVLVEIRAAARNPIELPSHSLFEGLNLGRGRSRNRHERNVALRKVHQGSVGVIMLNEQAALFPIRTEHGVIHDQLASASEEDIGESFVAAGRIENRVLLDFDPEADAAWWQSRRARG